EAVGQREEPAFEGGDSFAAATVLAAAIRKLGDVDLVLTGRQASDWDSGQVPAALAELLEVSGAVPVQKVELRDGELYVERVTEGGHQPVPRPMPSVRGSCKELEQ